MVVRKVVGLFACGFLVLALVCVLSSDPEMAELRGKVVEVVWSCFDVCGDVFLLDRVKDFCFVCIHVRAGGEGRGVFKVICWFDVWYWILLVVLLCYFGLCVIFDVYY